MEKHYNGNMSKTNGYVYLQKPAPATILDSVTVPCTDSIHFHSIQRHQNPEWASDVKCNLYVDDIKSNFVYVWPPFSFEFLKSQFDKAFNYVTNLILIVLILRISGFSYDGYFIFKPPTEKASCFAS
jgi:hypothetical protein